MQHWIWQHFFQRPPLLPVLRLLRLAARLLQRRTSREARAPPLSGRLAQEALSQWSKSQALTGSLQLLLLLLLVVVVVGLSRAS